MEDLIRLSRGLADRMPALPVRFLKDRIDWSWRLIGIRGARGTGKTTMLLQQMKGLDKAVYMSLDDLYFSRNTLRETVEGLRRMGYLHFFLDEVHKYSGWSREVKNLYDFYPDISVVFTGSSIIEMGALDVDLSRRALLYDLPGLSFREYLLFTGVASFEAFDIEELFLDHENISRKISRELRPLEHFSNYLKMGYYPFFLESSSAYQQRLRQVVRLVLETDIAQAEGAKVQQVHKLARLLSFLAVSTPFKPNVQKLARHLELDRATVLRYLSHLQKARLIGNLYVPGGGLSALQKPEKVYLDNTNLAYALPDAPPDTGSLRETFLFNQLSAVARCVAPDTADFLVNERYLLEVGGKGKKRRQLRGAPDSFLVLDDIETGVGDQVPLWLYGFLY